MPQQRGGASNCRGCTHEPLYGRAGDRLPYSRATECRWAREQKRTDAAPGSFLTYFSLRHAVMASSVERGPEPDDARGASQQHKWRRSALRAATAINQSERTLRA